MEQLVLFLKKDLSLPEKLISEVVTFYHEEKLAKGDYLVKKGQYLNKMCLVKNGYLRFFSYTEKKVITHWIFGQNKLTTDLAGFFLREPAKWTIQALTDTNVYTLTYNNYQRLRKEVPKWEQFEKTFLIKLMSAMENRVYALLSMSAEERYQYLYQSDSNMFNQLPLQYLASMLGMTPETLSRIRSKFNS